MTPEVATQPEATKPTKKAAPVKKASKKTSKKRPVLYPQPEVRLAVKPDYLTASLARELLGWTEETETVKFGSEFFVKDYHGTKVRCYNNVTNRPLYMGNVEMVKQEILRGNWAFNAEPIIVGKTGLILNGQHTLTALILAAQEWKDNKEHWREHWKSEPRIDKLVVYGVDESDKVVNTMDTCKPRSLADVIYRSSFFAKITSSDRIKLARILSYGIKIMWERTGAKANAHAPLRTHAESLDFVNRHERLVAASKHIYEENNGAENRINRYIGLGYAAGLLYLMGTCTTESLTKDKQGYGQVSDPNEDQLDFEKWDKAESFFTALAGGDKALFPVKSVLAELVENNGVVSFQERVTILVNAWNLYSEAKNVTPSAIKPDYHEDDEGVSHLVSNPVCGGIDLGRNAADDLAEEDEE